MNARRVGTAAGAARARSLFPCMSQDDTNVFAGHAPRPNFAPSRHFFPLQMPQSSFHRGGALNHGEPLGAAPSGGAAYPGALRCRPALTRTP